MGTCLSILHEILSINIKLFAFGEVSSHVEESEEDTAGRPRKFVPEWVCRALWCEEPTAVRADLFDLSTLLGVYQVSMGGDMDLGVGGNNRRDG